ncbi:MAG: TonB-dependent receptor [Bacteroidota bacterium]|nr:TonB-dependent receptor [Bacteroidota bacterium]
MSKKLKLLFSLLSVSSIAFAQEDTLHGKQLQEVIVTANKIEQKQNATGKVITVINKEQIEKAGSKSLPQLLNELAGITINGAYGNAGSVQTIYMRGASAGRTLVLMDGIPVNDPSQINNDFDLNLFSINDVERIEVCKGAQSTLYGSDAIGGVVNIITAKKDITKAFNGKATVSMGNKNTSRNNIQLYGKVGKLTYTTRFSQLKTDGFSAAYDSTGKNNFDADGYKGNVTNTSLQYQATPALSIKTFVQYSNYRADIDAGPFTDKRNYFLNNTAFFTGTGFTYKKSALSITGNYQYSKSTRHYDDNYSTGGSTYTTIDYRGFTNFYELYASYKISKNFTALVGNDFRYASMDGAYNSSAWGSSPNKDSSLYQYSAYASIIAASTNGKWHADLGGRINNHSRYGNNSTYTFNPSYNINTHWRLMGSISTGFKAPSIYQLYDTYSGNINLKPEESVNYEVGIQQSHNKINSRLVFFYRNIDNGIDYNYITYKYFNYVNQIVRGIELEVTAKPLSHLNITANYTYLAGQETSQNRKTNQDTVTYNYLLRRPKHNVNIQAGYQFSNALYVSVSGKYVSSRYDIGGYQAADVSLAAYTLLSAYAEYKLNTSVKFFVDAQNITNKKFFDVYGYNSIPFMINGGITFQF